MPGRGTVRSCTAVPGSAKVHSGCRRRCQLATPARVRHNRGSVAKKDRHLSETPATAWLRSRGIAFGEHAYDYVDRGGTAESSRQLGVPEHEVVKTLVMEDDTREPLVVLMHGDLQVSTKNLAREIGVKSIEPCRPDVAQRHSGYQVGGTSPFATRVRMPVFMEESILALAKAYVNGGKRGYLVGLAPQDLQRLLLSAAPGELLGPLGEGPPHTLVRMVAKHEPRLEDPALRTRLERRILSSRLSDLAGRRVSWVLVLDGSA